MTKRNWTPILEAAKRIGVARPTLWTWLGELPAAQVRREGRKWFLDPDLVERLRRDQGERRAVAAKAFEARSGILGQLQRDVERLKRDVAALKRERSK